MQNMGERGYHFVSIAHSISSLFYDGVVDIQIWALLTRSQCKVSDTQVTVRACGPLVPRRDGSENTVMTFKFFFSRSSWPISTKLVTKHPSVIRVQVCSNKGTHFFQREESSKMKTFSYLLLQTQWAYFNQTCHKTSLGEEDSGMFKSKAKSLSKGRFYKHWIIILCSSLFIVWAWF